MINVLRISVIVSAVLFAIAAQSNPLGATLTGRVSFEDSSPVEGAVVTALKSGASIAISVVSGRDGDYSFPAEKLGPGEYSLTVEATGYDLSSERHASIKAGAANRTDLVLKKTESLATQLNNAEWILSAPGTDDQKGAILLCVSCHTYERVFTSKHNVAEFETVVTRMIGYAPGTIPLRPQVRPNTNYDHPERFEAVAKYLSGVNLSSRDTWPYPLKVLPRPEGRGTRIIITQYKLPRPDMQPHDVVLDKSGTPWYGDFGQQYLGRLNTKTGEIKEYPVPENKVGQPLGMLDVEFDKENNLWVGMMLQDAIGKLNVGTGQIQEFGAPGSELTDDTLQIPMVAPENMQVDGKVWMDVVSTRGFHGVQRLEVATGKFEMFDIFHDSGNQIGDGASIGEGSAAPARDFWGFKAVSSNTYDIASDSNNSLYFSDFLDAVQARIGKVDSKTGKIEWFYMPTEHARPRRISMDSKDQLWIAEFRGNKIAMFDTKTNQFLEWQLPPGTYPYDVMTDANGDVWTSGEYTDRLIRLNPKTKEIVQYPLPRNTDVRRIWVDSSTRPVTVWIGSNHAATILKLEPLD